MPFEFAPISRGWFPLRIAIAAESGEGKTLSAVKLAVGLAGNNPEKVYFADTDNERGRFYADLYAPKRINYLSFPPPHSPARFGEVIAAAEQRNAEVLVIDCASDEWEGVGGCADLAEKDKGSWLRPKNQHFLKFMTRASHSNMHIIFTLIVKPVGMPDKDKEKAVKRTPAKFANRDFGLVCEKSFMRPMTLGIFVSDKGRRTEVYKVFEGLKPTADKITGAITEQHGFILRQWVEGLSVPDIEVEKAKTALKTASVEGMAKLQEVRRTISDDILRKVGGQLLSELKAAAEEFDKQREGANNGEKT